MRIRKILWPTDFSECAGAAFDHAIRMASRHHAALDLLHVAVLSEEDPFLPPDRLPGREEIRRRLRQVAAREKTRQIAASAATPIEIGRHQRRARAAAPEILRFATEHAADLIVIGGHGRRGFRQNFLGNVVEEVVRLAACPVLTVREPDLRAEGAPGGTRRAEGAPGGTLVVPVDFSEHSAAALRAAKGLSVVHGGRLDLVHVVEPVTGPRDAGTGKAPLERIEGRLAAFADEVLGRPRVDFRVEVIEGIAAASITAYAESSKADLIAIATQGLTGLRQFLLDSVTEKIVRTATCPVLTIKGPRAPDAHEGAAAGLA